MVKVLLQGRIAADHQEIFQQHLRPGWQMLVWDPALHEKAEFAAMAAAADVIVGGNIPTTVWPQTPKLKLFQIPWTGYNFTTPARMPAGISVANCFEHESAIAEYVMLAMLEWQIGLRTMDERFRREGWGGRAPAGGIYHGEIKGATVGIVGYGHIGREIAARAAPFGLRVIGTRRKKVPAPPELDWLGDSGDLSRLLAESDFVVIACDLNDQTKDLINSETLTQMKSSGVLINVSRGGVVEEQALYNALVAKKIGGAVIDVWYNYNSPDKPDVWPSNFPFEKLDNVILSAHECGWTHEQTQRRWKFVGDNVERAVNGEPLLNVVFTGEALAGVEA